MDILIGNFGVGVLISNVVQLIKLAANGAGWDAPENFFGVLTASFATIAQLLIFFGPGAGIDLGAAGDALRGANELISILVGFAGAFVPYLLATRVSSNS